MKIIFMGTPDFAVPVLQKLIDEKFEIVMVVTQPDRIQGRKKEVIYSPVKKLALENNLKIFQPLKIKDEYQFILDQNADLMITAAYGQILPRKLLDGIKALNVHGSLLPALRGGAPIQYALFQGLEKTGVTIMDMVFKMDAGDIILQGDVEITNNDTYGSLSEKMSYVGADLLIKVLKGNYPRIKQNEDLVTFSPTLKREDEFLDFNLDADQVLNRLKGLLPDPAASIKINDENYKVYNMIKSDIINIYSPGEIVINKNQMLIASKTQLLEIIEIQAPGKRQMLVKDFLNGQKLIKNGDYVERGI